MRLMLLPAIAIAVLSDYLPASAQAQVAAPTLKKDVVVDVIVPPQPATPRSPTAQPANPPTSPTFPSFNSQQLDRQLQRYIAYIEQYGTPDILIVGSSRALQGVDPLVLQKALEQQGYGKLKTYNFGINGATAQVVDWLLRKLLSPEQLPRLILWADGSRAFNNGRVDHTFNKILTSKGHQQLFVGTRPAVASTTLKLGQVCMDLFPVSLLNQPPSANLNARSVTVLPADTSTTPRSPLPDCKQPLKLLVQQPSGSSSSPVQAASGFQVVDTQFDPNTYFQRYSKVPGSFDADYRDFNLSGKQAQSLRNVTQFVRDRNIPLVVVNLPLTDAYLDSTRSWYENQFRQQMQRSARVQGFIFADLSQVQPLMQNRYFADPSHLNRFGAVMVASQLAKALKPIWATRITPYLSQKQPDSPSQNVSCSYACLYFPGFLRK